MRESSTDPSRVRELVLQFGWNSTSYQILNPGISHWIAPGGTGVVGYVRQRGHWIAAGAPVCAESNLAATALAFESAARETGRGARACYFCVADRLRNALASTSREPHATMAIGAEPVWDPRGWPDRVRRHRSLRAQLNRARNKGIRAIAVPIRPVPYRAALQTCLEEWLGSRGLPPMHFLVEPDTLGGVLEDRRLYVAMRESDDTPVAFLIASPVPLRNGYLIEQIARGHAAPNGTAELLIDTAMRDLADSGATYVTQGLVALSTYAQTAMAENPLWIRALMAWARAHGRRFYNFAGLEAFREKMEPDAWETVYAIANEPRFSPMTLHAVARAFCHGSPVVAVTRALGKAVRQEIKWLRNSDQSQRKTPLPHA